MATGGCRCGAVRYEISGDPLHHALCHCGDCRRSAGAPVVGWIAYPEDQVTIAGDPVTYVAKQDATRQFCGTCGTGLFYRNEASLPGLIDIQSSTLDDPAAFAPGAHIQVAERLPWMTGIDALPEFERYPGM